VVSFSVRQVAERYGVSVHTVLAWITKTGELRAVNVGRSPAGKKPRWRVTEQALAAFEARRTPTPTAPRARRQRRATRDIVAFY
jgi:excisionase family DNA binding protein